MIVRRLLAALGGGGSTWASDAHSLRNQLDSVGISYARVKDILKTDSSTVYATN